MKKDSRNRLLVGGIVGTLSISLALIGVMLVQENPHSLSASISDAIARTSASPVPGYPAATVVPRSLTDNPVTAATGGPEGDSVRYFETQTGRAFQIDLKTRKATVISDKKIPNFIGATWSPSTNTFISFQASRASLVFSSDGQKIAYLQSDGDAATLFVSDADGTNARKILATRALEPSIAWPSSTQIALSSHQIDHDGRNVTLVGLDGSLTPLLSDRTNLETVWSRDGSSLLYSYFTADAGIQLWVLGGGQSAPASLGITTGAHKCAWHPDGVTITCGVPANTSLSDSTSSAHSATRDDIITINTLTGEQKKIYSAQSGAYIGVIDPLVSSSESFFVFTNLFDQRLYSIAL